MRDKKLREYLGIEEFYGHNSLVSKINSLPEKVNLFGCKQEDLEKRLKDLTLKFNALLDFWGLEAVYSTPHYKVERKDNARNESKGNKKSCKTTSYDYFTS